MASPESTTVSCIKSKSPSGWDLYAFLLPCAAAGRVLRISGSPTPDAGMGERIREAEEAMQKDGVDAAFRIILAFDPPPHFELQARINRSGSVGALTLKSGRRKNAWVVGGKAAEKTLRDAQTAQRPILVYAFAYPLHIPASPGGITL